MYIVVQHTFLNSPKAFARGESLIKNEGAPDGTTGLQFYPAVDGSGATCLWKSNNVADVQRYVDDTLGDSSRNLCYEVDTANAFARQPLGIAEWSTLVAQ
jgi:hypothetical protein